MTVAPQVGRLAGLRAVLRTLLPVVAALAGCFAVTTQAAAVTVTAGSRGAASSPAPGVSLWREAFSIDNHPQQAVFASVHLSNTTWLGVGIAHGAVGSADETTSSMTTRTGAVLGMNADLFAMGGSGLPQGGAIVGSNVLKSPNPSWQAELSQLSDGRVVIGAVGYTATVTSVSGRPWSLHVGSVNTVVDAERGAVTQVTAALTPGALPPACAAVTAIRSGSHWRVVSVRSALARTLAVPRGGWEFLGCHAAATLLVRTFHAGQTVALRGALASPMTRRGEQVRTMISGARVLLRSGHAYSDPGRFVTWGRNPETFACVSRDGYHLLLGVLDGRRAGAAGVTLTELGSYLQWRGCWDALVFDGGGSTTLAERAVGRARVLNVPADWGYERPVADALLVFAR